MSAVANASNLEVLGFQEPGSADCGLSGPSAQVGAEYTVIRTSSPRAVASAMVASRLPKSYAGSAGFLGLAGSPERAMLLQRAYTLIIPAPAASERSSQRSRSASLDCW